MNEPSSYPISYPITSEFFPASANSTNDAYLHIKTRGFWSIARIATCFDFGILYPIAFSYCSLRALFLLINLTRMPRSMNTVIELGTLTSLHWFLLQLMAWNVRILYFIGSWLICLQLLEDRQGRSRWSGWSGFGRTTFSQGKIKIPFYKKQLRINKSTRVIFGLSRLVIL